MLRRREQARILGASCDGGDATVTAMMIPQTNLTRTTVALEDPRARVNPSATAAPAPIGTLPAMPTASRIASHAVLRSTPRAVTTDSAERAPWRRTRATQRPYQVTRSSAPRPAAHARIPAVAPPRLMPPFLLRPILPRRTRRVSGLIIRAAAGRGGGRMSICLRVSHGAPIARWPRMSRASRRRTGGPSPSERRLSWTTPPELVDEEGSGSSSEQGQLGMQVGNDESSISTCWIIESPRTPAQPRPGEPRRPTGHSTLQLR